MTERSAPGTPAMIWALAGITLRRLARGKALWIGGLFAVLPVIYAVVMHARGVKPAVDQLFALTILLLVLLPAMLLGASIGEDLEDGTSTYLWSRPIARWAVPAGKLCTLAPIVIALIVASWCIGVTVWTQAAPSLASCLGLATGCVAVSLVAAGIATLVPKHAMALTIGYMLVDLFFGEMPFSLAEVSITHHARIMSGAFDDPPALAGPLIGMAVIAAIWTAVGLLRIRRFEA